MGILRQNTSKWKIESHTQRGIIHTHACACMHTHTHIHILHMHTHTCTKTIGIKIKKIWNVFLQALFFYKHETVIKIISHWPSTILFPWASPRPCWSVRPPLRQSHTDTPPLCCHWTSCLWVWPKTCNTWSDTYQLRLWGPPCVYTHMITWSHMRVKDPVVRVRVWWIMDALK